MGDAKMKSKPLAPLNSCYVDNNNKNEIGTINKEIAMPKPLHTR